MKIKIELSPSGLYTATDDQAGIAVSGRTLGGLLTTLEEALKVMADKAVKRAVEDYYAADQIK